MKAKAFAAVLFAFILGVIFRSYFIIDALVVFIVSFIFAIIYISDKKKITLFIFFLLLFFGIGTYRLENYMAAVQGHPAPFLPFAAVVMDVKNNDMFGSQTYLLRSLNDNYYVSLRTKKYPKYSVGDFLEINGSIKKNDRSADIKEQIYYSFNYPEEIKKIERDQFFSTNYTFLLREKVAFLKQSLNNKIRHIFPEPHSSLVEGILLGGRSNFSNEMMQIFSVAGITHIIAVSGYNVVIVAAFVIFLTKGFSNRSSFWLSIFGIWFFVILTGATASVVRAGIMGSALLFSKKSGRKYYPLTSIMVAGTMMVFFNPLILFYDLGFQLSFLATIGIVYLSEPIKNILKIKGWAADILVIGLAAQILTLPLIAYKFGMLSLVSPIANFFIVLSIPFLMMAAAISVAFGFVSSSLGSFFGFFAWCISVYIFKLAQFFASLSFAKIEFNMSIYFLFIIYLLIINLKILSLRHEKKKTNLEHSLLAVS